MNLIQTTIVGAVLISGCATPKVTEVAEEQIHFVGRFDKADPSAPKFEWPATSIKTRLQGMGISVDLDDNGNHYEVLIDGVATEVLKTTAGRQTYPLRSWGVAGEHSVEVIRRTEPSLGTAQFFGFQVSGGQLVAAKYPVTRRVEIIGDSIAAGYGVEGDSPSCPFTPETENAHVTYGPLAGRTLDAEVTLLAWSGKGMLRDNAGDTSQQFAALYERAIPTDTTNRFDFTSATSPDAIVINLGDNDFGPGDPGLAFQTSYLDFLKQLRNHHPNAVILCGIGPMTQGTALSQAKTYIQNAISAANDTKMHFISWDVQDIPNDGAGCDSHPNRTTHQKMANVLVTALKQRMGW